MSVYASGFLNEKPKNFAYYIPKIRLYPEL